MKNQNPTNAAFAAISAQEMMDVNGGSALGIAFTIISWTVFFCSLPTKVQ